MKILVRKRFIVAVVAVALAACSAEPTPQPTPPANAGYKIDAGAETVQVKLNARQYGYTRSMWPSEVVAFTRAEAPIAHIKDVAYTGAAADSRTAGAALMLMMDENNQANVQVMLSLQSAKFDENPELQIAVVSREFAKVIQDSGGVQIEWVKEQ